MSRDDLDAAVTDRNAMNELAERLTEKKKNITLAKNDALMIFGTYGLRKKFAESTKKGTMGFATWWLTNEFFVVDTTKTIVREQGARYLMRPDYLLNFIALSPQAASIRATYATVFPSTIGLAVGRRVRPEAMQDVLEQLREFKETEPGRIAVKVAELSDKLKSDLHKRYDRELRD
jgi:hypothetical protein